MLYASVGVSKTKYERALVGWENMSLKGLGYMEDGSLAGDYEYLTYLSLDSVR